MKNVWIYVYPIFLIQYICESFEIDVSKADLVAYFKTNDGIEHVEAFRSIQNDEILKNQDRNRYNQLEWYSIGLPRLVVFPSKNNTNQQSKLLWTPEGFFVNVDMLTFQHKQEFKKVIQRKYQIEVKEHQILYLRPASIQCNIRFFSERVIYNISGKSKQLNSVGMDSENIDFAKIGNMGGQNKVKLNISQMPSHNHIDEGHKHFINVNSSSNGEHSHGYREITYSNMDEKKFGWFSRISGDRWGKTHSSGSHINEINGDSEISNANISFAGSNEEHENRPPYFVIAYIIYLG
jgi:microcystin-dependent protein